MKKSIFLIIIAFAIILISTAVFAADTSIQLEKDKEEYKPKDTVQITANVKNIALENGIETVICRIQYNKSLYESCQIEGKNGWKVEGFNEATGKVILQRENGIKTDSDVFVIKLKLNDVSDAEDTISITEINLSDEETDLYPQDTNIPITIIGETPNILKEESKYSIENENLIGIKTGTTIETLRENINEAYTIKVIKKNGTTEVTIGNVGTGMKVEVYKNGVKKTELTVIIKGDINGDGLVSGPDSLRMLLHRKKKQILTGIELQAGDITGDGKITGPDSLRVLLHRKHKPGYEL